MGELSVWHWLIVFGVATLLFGTNKLPDAARAVGRSMRIFRSEIRGIEDQGGTSVVDGSGPAVAEPAGSGPAAAASAGPVPAAEEPPAQGVGGRGSAQPGGDARARAE